jgi:heptosyltransferase-1
MAWRKWRHALHRPATWQAISQLQAALRQTPYDLTLDLQGLVKSALWARMAQAPVAGPDWPSAREGLASCFYSRKASAPWGNHAVVRSRMLAAAHLGYALPDSPPDFGLRAPLASWQAPPALAALIPNASRSEKFWPEAHWQAVGRRLLQEGMTPVVLWGNEAEQQMAQRIAAGCSGVLPPFLKVGEMAGVLAQARMVVGLDTGFSHLAAALGRPTVGIYCDHEPSNAGITGTGGVDSIGGKGQRPSLPAVMALVEARLDALKAARLNGNLTGA